MTNADGTPEPPAVVPPALPRYGEMAPPGYVLPNAQPTPVVQPPQGSPTPQYGAPPYGGQQYQGQQYQGQQYGGQFGYAPVRQARPRTADVTITCILLTLGLFGMLTGVGTGAGLGPALQQEYSKYGLTFTGGASLPGLQATLIVSHVVLFLAALGVSIPLLVKKRTAFWVPLVAGVVAAIFFWAVIFSLIIGDPALMHAINSANGVG